MEKETIIFIIEIVAAIVAFLVGRYILPKHKTTIQNAANQFELLFKYAESFCAHARQFLSELSGSEKMDSVIEKLNAICVDLNIEVDDEVLRAIAQKAYDAMIIGENSSKVIIESAIEELKLFDEVESEVAVSNSNTDNN